MNIKSNLKKKGFTDLIDNGDEKDDKNNSSKVTHQ